MSKDEPPFEVVAELTALRRYALALARDQHLAEDLVQEALVRAYEKRSTFRPDAKLKTWLFSVLHNVFVDGMRKRRAEAPGTPAYHRVTR
jgi:RNA polymerase sigma-70 factor (ECF subfamily)